MLPDDSETALRSPLKSRLSRARKLTDELFSVVRPEAIHDRPIPERHRIIFYLGHLEAFDRNLLCRDSLGIAPFNSDFDRLFAFGIDPVDGSLPADKPSDWPSVKEIEGYNREAREKIDACLETAPLGDGAAPNLRGGWAFNMAIEHRLMHAETLAYMLHWMPLDRKIAPPPEPEFRTLPVARRMIEIPEGSATLGLERGEHPFLGWDNEYERHAVRVPAFTIESHNVTNGDFLEFVEAGGYREPGWWSKEDWDWIQSRGIRHPHFWKQDSGQWRFIGMFRDMPLPLSRPVYLSHAEASAYARWAGKDLPTEAQFHRAAYGTPEGAERPFPWGEEPPLRQGNFDFHHWDPAPVGAFPQGVSAFGVHDLVGNGWEWTSSVFEPFPGFEPLPFYRTYSANFFDGRHYVMKGGSSRTDASMLRRSFRNWFQRHYPYIYAAFRCVEN